jgi:DNA-binding GntR family transcriptional regulator
VREALKTLEGEGVVLYRPRFGYSVTVLDLNELVEMYRMRELLESELMRGVTAFSGSLQRELAESISELASWPSRDVAGCTRINRDFHMALFRGADLPRTFHVIRLLWDMTEPYRALYYADPSNIRRVVTEHQLIVDAIMAGDRAMLIRRLNEHRNSALARLRGVLSRGSGG